MNTSAMAEAYVLPVVRSITAAVHPRGRGSGGGARGRTMVSEQTRESGAFARAAATLAAEPATGMRVLPRAAELLRPVAPGLADIMTSSAVRACAESYPRYSAEAARQQSLLMREATRANLCLLGAGLLSGLVLVAPNAALVLGEPLTQWVILLLGLATLALGALAAMFSYRARESDRLRRWYTARSQAELARLGTFRALAAAATAAGGDTAAAALALVWRHLFEDQRQWLASRAARHRLSYERTNLWGGIASALAFLGGSGAVIASFKPSQSWITVAGVVSAAIAAYALGREGSTAIGPTPTDTRNPPWRSISLLAASTRSCPRRRLAGPRRCAPSSTR
ncbi:MAG: hypothetical protein U1E52_13155 [Geminicoccaceae bacterium]